MKMISHQQNKRARQKKLQHLTLALLFLVLVGFLNITNRNPLSGVAHFITVPILKSETAVGNKLNDYSEIVRSKKALIQTNNRLQEAFDETEGLRILNEALRAENEELKHLLGRDAERNLLLAIVVSKPNASAYDTIVIDVGSEDGVHVGDEIIAHGDFLVGFVSKVFRNSSQVTLFSTPGEKTNIQIGTSSVAAVAVGRGAGNFRAELPRDVEVKVGDVITLANLNTQVFGEVETVIRGEADAFQQLLFQSPINVFTIKRVQVVLQDSLNE